MKKFTKLLHVMTLLLLMSSVTFAQVVITPQQKAEKGKAEVKSNQPNLKDARLSQEMEKLAQEENKLKLDMEKADQEKMAQQQILPQSGKSASILEQGVSEPIQQGKVKENVELPADIAPGVTPTQSVVTPIDFSAVYKYGGGAPDAVLYDNGPFVTHPGGGAGGADASVLQSSLGMGTYGNSVNHAALPGEYYYIADDFMATGTWTLNSIKFFGYQTGSTTTSTFTGVYVQIWNGDPALAGSSVVWGDLTTNRILSTAWTNSYRTLETDIGTATLRPIMEVVANMAGCVLSPANYWVQWGLTGSMASGPWGHPVTILGQTTTGNAKQKTTSGSSGWVNLVDVGPQGLPFVIDGTTVSSTIDVAVTAISSPVSGNVGVQNVTITVANYGTTTQSNIPVSYIFDGITYNGSVPGPIAQFGTASYTFAQTINPSAGTHTIQACANVPGDEVPGNNCLSKNITITPAYACNWTVELYDTWGDGWNGGTLSVIVDGFTLLNNVTLASGAGPAIYAFGVNDGSVIQTVFTAGGWPEECFYEIYDSYGIFVASSGPLTGGPPNLTLTGNCTPPACPAPTGLTTSSITNTGARANWVKGGAEALWNLEYGPIGFVQGTGTLLTGLPNPNPFGNPYYDITGLTPGGVYEWYVQADCGAGSTSFWTKSSPFQTTAPVPPNDQCINAALITGPYPQTVNGTTNGATIDCPGVLDWHAVWYEITLPYAVNNFTVNYCGTLNQGTIGIVYYNDCLDCAAYIIANSYEFVTCPGGETAGTMAFNGIVGPGTILFPAYTATPQGYTQDFTVTFNVQELLPQPGCQNTSLYPSSTVPVSATGSVTTISSCNYAGEYSRLSNIQAGKNYQFTMSNLGTGAYITVTDGPGPASNVFAYGPSPLNYLAATGADLYVHWSLNEFCDTDFSCHVTTAQCLDCVATGPDCGNTYLGMITPGAAWQTASYLAGDTYYWGFNATAGTTYGFENCLAGEDTYIRIYDAAFMLVASADDNGPYCSGTAASIDWLSPASGTYYISLARYSCALLVNNGDLNYRTVPACIVTCPPGSIPEGEPCGDDINGGCNSAIPVFSPITFGATVCGNYWAAGGTRDTDWYEVTTTNPLTKITMNFEGEIPSVFGFIEQIVPGVPGCANISGSISPYQSVPACTPAFIEVFVEPGTYYFFIGASVFDGYPCPGFTYVAGWTAENISVYEVTGKLTYASPAATPIDNSLVLVYDNTDPLNPVLLGEVPTNDFGDYIFYATGGDYMLSASTCKPRGGTNVADVNLVVAHLLGNPLTGLQFLSADVNDDGLISVGDYNLLVSELLGSNPVWAAPDWVFESPSFTLSGDLIVNFQGLASGDPDGSYAVPFGNLCPCGFIITISGTGFLDETYFTFTDNLSNVVLSAGSFAYGSTNIFTHVEANPPYTFYLTTIGSFSDNVADYMIENSFGDILFQGTVLGGTDVTITNIICNP